MTDDIVTRLREEAITIVENNGFWLDVPNAFNNCADEIERLRGEIERLRSELAEAHHAVGVYQKMTGIQPTITKFGDE